MFDHLYLRPIQLCIVDINSNTTPNLLVIHHSGIDVASDLAGNFGFIFQRRLPRQFPSFIYDPAKINYHVPRRFGHIILCGNDKGISMAEKRQQYASLTNDDYCWNLKDLAINGSELMKLGYKGTAVGKTLHALLDDVIHERIRNKKDELLNAAHPD